MRSRRALTSVVNISSSRRFGEAYHTALSLSEVYAYSTLSRRWDAYKRQDWRLRPSHEDLARSSSLSREPDLQFRPPLPPHVLLDHSAGAPIVQVATPPPPAGVPAAAARGTTFCGAPTSLKRPCKSVVDAPGQHCAHHRGAASPAAAQRPPPAVLAATSDDDSDSEAASSSASNGVASESSAEVLSRQRAAAAVRGPKQAPARASSQRARQPPSQQSGSGRPTSAKKSLAADRSE